MRGPPGGGLSLSGRGVHMVSTMDLSTANFVPEPVLGHPPCSTIWSGIGLEAVVLRKFENLFRALPDTYAMTLPWRTSIIFLRTLRIPGARR
jgi:hypothetical protein